MIWILDQQGTSAYNLSSVGILSVVDNHIVIDEGNTKRIVARYPTDSEAEEVFGDMLHDLEAVNAVPFADSDFTVYELPGDGSRERRSR